MTKNNDEGTMGKSEFPSNREVGATDYQNWSLLDQLCDALLPQLIKRVEYRLTLNQRVTGSSPVRLTIKYEKSPVTACSMG
jgi:hypothetical protein